VDIDGVYIFSKHVLCYFAHLTDLHGLSSLACSEPELASEIMNPFAHSAQGLLGCDAV